MDVGNVLQLTHSFGYVQKGAERRVVGGKWKRGDGAEGVCPPLVPLFGSTSFHNTCRSNRVPLFGFSKAILGNSLCGPLPPN